MENNLTHRPKHIKCLKSFYGFEEGDIFRWHNEHYYELEPRIRATGSFVHFDLLDSLKDGYFVEHIQTPDEAFESELNDAANKIKDEVAIGTGGGERVKIGFREGVKWLQERLKNQ